MPLDEWRMKSLIRQREVENGFWPIWFRILGKIFGLLRMCPRTRPSWKRTQRRLIRTWSRRESLSPSLHEKKVWHYSGRQIRLTLKLNANRKNPISSIRSGISRCSVHNWAWDIFQRIQTTALGRCVYPTCVRAARTFKTHLATSFQEHHSGEKPELIITAWSWCTDSRDCCRRHLWVWLSVSLSNNYNLWTGVAIGQWATPGV